MITFNIQTPWPQNFQCSTVYGNCEKIEHKIKSWGRTEQRNILYEPLLHLSYLKLLEFIIKTNGLIQYTKMLCLPVNNIYNILYYNIMQLVIRNMTEHVCYYHGLFTIDLSGNKFFNLIILFIMLQFCVNNIKTGAHRDECWLGRNTGASQGWCSQCVACFDCYSEEGKSDVVRTLSGGQSPGVLG